MDSADEADCIPQMVHHPRRQSCYARFPDIEGAPFPHPECKIAGIPPTRSRRWRIWPIKRWGESHPKIPSNPKKRKRKSPRGMFCRGRVGNISKTRSVIKTTRNTLKIAYRIKLKHPFPGNTPLFPIKEFIVTCPTTDPPVW